MASNEKSLSLIIRAVDSASPVLKSLSGQIEKGNASFAKGFARLGENFGFSKIGSSLKDVGSGIASVGKEAASLIKHFATMATVGGFAAYEIIKSTVDAGDQLKMMADRTGLAVDQFAALRFSAGQAHVEQEEFNTSMDRLNKNLGEAKAGGGTLLTFLQKVSPTLAKQVRAANSTGEALTLLTKAFALLPDSEKRAALGAAAFGRGGKQTGEWLHQGTEAIAAQGAEYLKIAGSQAAFADQSEDVKKQLLKMDAAFDGAKNGAMLALYPAITELSKGVSEFIAQNRDGLTKWATEAGKAISDWVKGGGLKDLADSIRDIATALKKGIDFVGGFGNALKILALIQAGPLLASTASLALNIGKLGLGMIGSTVQAVGWIRYLWMMRASIMGGLIPSLVSGAASLWAFVAPLLVAAAPVLAVVAAVGALAWAGYEIYKNWDNLKGLFKDFWQTITFYAARAWDKIKPIVEDLKIAGEAIGSVFAHPLDSLKTAGQFYFGGSSEAASAGAASLAQSSSSNVSHDLNVTFGNTPPGTRVSASGPNVSTEVNYSRGPSMVGG